MTTRQERLAARRKRIERQATTIVQEAVTRVVAARPCRKCRVKPGPDGTITHRISCTDYSKGNIQPIARIVPGPDTRPSRSTAGESDPQEVKRLRDGGMAWWVIGQQLGLAGAATSASEGEAKRGAGRARALYAAANRGEVPRTHKPRAGAAVKPTGPGRGGTVTARKEQLVRDGHVIPRDMPDEEVEALLRGRTIEWAIDLARLTETPPESWGPDDTRWCKQDARVHPDSDWVYVGEEDKFGNRLVRFREYLGRGKNGEMLAGPTRTVRVDAIYTIR